MPQLRKRYEIEPKDFVRAGEVSLQVQRTLRNLGFDEDLIRRASICAYEAEMNIVMYGGKGELVLTVSPNEIVLNVNDDGVGIEDIAAALKEGYSTASAAYREMGFGAGMGLPNIKRNADFLDIHSGHGQGTCLNIVFNFAGDLE